MKATHSEIRNAHDITESHIREYIEHRADSCSNFTLSKDLSAINRSLFGCTNERDFYKLSDFGDYKRRTEDIVNNRGLHTEHHTNHYARNEAQLLAQAFGFRRSSLEAGKLTTDNLVWRDGHIIGCHTVEKGGKEHCAYCLYDYRDAVEKYVAERVERLGEGCSLSDGIDSNCAVHQYRATFVKDVVRELSYDWSPLHQHTEFPMGHLKPKLKRWFWKHTQTLLVSADAPKLLMIICVLRSLWKSILSSMPPTI